MLRPRMSPPPRPDLAHYSASARALDAAGILGFFAFAATLAVTLAPHVDRWTIAAAAAGWIGADFVSGLVHWFFDTWLRHTTPILGPVFVRPFREHHVDPLSITRHDFVEVNGSNCLATCPVLAGALFLDPESALPRAAAVALLALCLGIFATNQFHRWAHLPEPGPAIRALQDAGVILGRAHHAGHHAAPYDRRYCITTGWLNPLLDGVGFFRSLERVIHAATGAMPRAEDSTLA